ncbi:hypothetical protein ACFSQ7_03520 [Paenibacillus rhizoplanae]
MAMDINPSLKKVYIVYDNSESGLSTGQMVMDQIDAMKLGLELFPMNRLSMEQIQATASALSPDSIVLMTTYF